MLEFLKAVISSIFSLFLVLVFTFLSFIQNLSIPYQDDDFQIQSQQTNIYDYDDSFELIRDEDAYQASLNDVNALRKKCFYGTNQCLSGKVTAVVIYMNDFESSWTDEQMDEFTEKDVEPALAFLEQGAEKYGVELDFETKMHPASQLLMFWNRRQKAMILIRNTIFMTGWSRNVAPRFCS